ncbi:hypothetical protein OIU74_029764 [Salix koriyanagi]|uniref:Prolamin-like domain-containing protein n=1 Tax=Salix koriyanagi TaxID=2511006 RepID=A0A9Q0ZUU7_9ROSI|nr:hypothetical protein OIU74_029764 [Salix koriyanagi]
MARISTQVHAILLALACMEALVLCGFARDNPVGTLTDDQKNAAIPDCLAPFRTVVGCLDSINDALSGGNFLHIAPDCCKVVTSIDIECFSFLFPMNSSAPSLIVAFCDIIEPPKISMLCSADEDEDEMAGAYKIVVLNFEEEVYE